LAQTDPAGVALLRTARGVDLVGDIHGCYGAFLALLGELGYVLSLAPDGAVARAHHPGGRTLVLLGDLVDRGPEVLLVLRSAMALAAGGHLVLMGNHDAALLTALERLPPAAPAGDGLPARHPDDGWHTTEAAVAAMSHRERVAVRRFLARRPHHALVEVPGAPLLVAAHAGLPHAEAGLDSDAAWRHALYGDGRVADSRDVLLPDGTDWRATYTRESDAIGVYGHHAGAEPACVAQTVGIDTGCGYDGGRLSALRWPEGVVRAVAGGVTSDE
jgi:protein phosphatase